MTSRDTQPDRTERAAGIPIGPLPADSRSQRTPHPPDRDRVVVHSRTTPRTTPAARSGSSAAPPTAPNRPSGHGTPPRKRSGPETRPTTTRRAYRTRRSASSPDTTPDCATSSAPVTPLAVSWDRGKAADKVGVVWFSDGSTLPLASYLALLHHAGARADGTPPRGTVTWTAAPRWPTAAGRAGRATNRSAGAPEALGAARRRGPGGHGRDRRVEQTPIPAPRVKTRRPQRSLRWRSKGRGR